MSFGFPDPVMLMLTVVAEGPNFPLLEGLEMSVAETVGRGGMGGTGDMGIRELSGTGGGGEEPVALGRCRSAGAAGAARGLTNGVVGIVPDAVCAGAAIGSA